MLQKLTKFVYRTKTFLIVHQTIRLILDDPTSQTKHQLPPYPQGQLKAENRKKKLKKKLYAHFFFLRFMNFHLALKGFSYCSCTSKLHTFSSKWFLIVIDFFVFYYLFNRIIWLLHKGLSTDGPSSAAYFLTFVLYILWWEKRMLRKIMIFSGKGTGLAKKVIRLLPNILLKFRRSAKYR